MKAWKIVCLLSVITLGLVGCNSQQNIATSVQNPKDNQSTQSQNKVSNQTNNSTKSEEQDLEQTDTAQSTRTYVNQTDAWTVKLPSAWNEVQIVESSGMTEFIFPSKNPELKQSLFWVSTISEEEWQKAQSEGPTGSAKEITRKDGDIYLYYTPLDMVLEGDELKQYEDMIKDIPVIMESFTFE